MSIQVTAVYSNRGGGVGLYIDDVPKNGGLGGTVKMITIEAVTENELFKQDGPPPVTLDKTAAQKLIDTLWDCGLRPSEGSGSAGCLAATQRHLEDMRTLVFQAGDIADVT